MTLLLEDREEVRWLTIDRPEVHNALPLDAYWELAAAFRATTEDAQVRSVVITGAGERAFCAGTDINEFATFASGADGLRYERTVAETLRAIEEAEKPTVALVNGFAVGGGLLIAAACDFRICSPSASFGAPLAKTIGNCLTAENLQRLSALVGAPRVREIIIAGRMLSAADALAFGLATQVLDDPQTARRAAQKFAESVGGGAPLTIAATKALLRGPAAPDAVDDSEWIQRVYGSEDFQLGVAAFRGHVPPSWGGR